MAHVKTNQIVAVLLGGDRIPLQPTRWKFPADVEVDIGEIAYYEVDGIAPTWQGDCAGRPRTTFETATDQLGVCRWCERPIRKTLDGTDVWVHRHNASRWCDTKRLHRAEPREVVSQERPGAEGGSSIAIAQPRHEPDVDPDVEFDGSREDAPQVPRTSAPQEHPVAEGSTMDGDGPCAQCGTQANIVWFTDSVFWNNVFAGTDENPILCIRCFVHQAENAGFRPTGWRLTPEWPWRRSTDGPEQPDRSEVQEP